MSATAASLNDKPARLPRWTNNLLVMVLGVIMAMFALSFLPKSKLPMAGPVTFSGSVNAASKAPDAMQLGKKTAALHVFGDPAKPEKKVDTPPPVVGDTKLNLKLAGVFAFEPKETAFAIISEGSGEQNAYGIGDKISGETRLVEVFPEYVIINNRGKNEKLKLSDTISSSAGSQQPIQRASAPRATQQNSGQPIELPTNPGELRDTLARNPSMLGRVVAAEPYQENGKLVGYRITPKQNPEILEAQGIIGGDVITRVNNIQLNSQKQGIRALRNAVKAENLEVMILRDGIEIPVSISLAQ